MGLQDYLAFCVQALERLGEFPVVHVVVGNESCDLDSAVSAISYAYFLYETSLAPVGTVLFLPLLNIPRSDFPLRTEIAYLLGKYGVTAADLVFQDDLDLRQVKVASELKLTLVDHHVLSGSSLADFEDCVVQILDHRPVDGDLPDKCDSTVEQVGSCCTLVAEAMMSEETFVMDPVIATLLYGTIVTDTINFLPAAGKTTSKDVTIAERLEDSVDGGIDQHSLFEEIKAAKFDLSGLTSTEILRKDLKMVSGDSLLVAMCSVTMDLRELMSREDFETSLKSFAEDRGVDAVVVLTLSSGADDSITRQLGVFSPSRVYREQMADVLNSSHSPSLALSPLKTNFSSDDHNHDLGFLTFNQGNVKASRKQVLPIVRAFLAGDTTPDETQTDAYDDLPKDTSEGFTSMSSIRGGKNQNSATTRDDDDDDVEITSEELISRDEDSTEGDLSLSSALEENLLPVDHHHLHHHQRGRIFDPLSSIHSSDNSGAPSPQDPKWLAGGVGVGVGGDGEVPSSSSSPPLLVSPSKSQSSPVKEGFGEGFQVVGDDDDDSLDQPSGGGGGGGEGGGRGVEGVVKENEDDVSSSSSAAPTTATTTTGEDGEVSGEIETGHHAAVPDVLVSQEEEQQQQQQDDSPPLNEDPPAPLPNQQHHPYHNHHHHEHNHNHHHHNHQDDNVQVNHNGNADDNVDPAQLNGLELEAGQIIINNNDDDDDGGGGGGNDNHHNPNEDFLGMASPHDLLFPAESSPLDALSAATSGQVSGQTSGQTSGQGSKAPSYPVTPPNSYMEGQGGMSKEVHLPSFNSLEMVEKIHERQAALINNRRDRDREEGEALGNNSSNSRGNNSRDLAEGGSSSRTVSTGSQDTPDPPLSPFTPQNSYVDTPVSPQPPGGSVLSASGLPPRQKETQLPSFHSSDMVERIREKRSSMERDVLGEEGSRGSSSPGEAGAEPHSSLLLPVDADRNPFTPHNSFIEGGFDRFARENLPSLNSAEIANKIRQKQAELSAITGGEDRGGDSGTASPGLLAVGSRGEGNDSPAAPYTPQNSFRDSHMMMDLNRDSRITDLNEVAERLSLTGSESSGSLNDPPPKSVKASNKVHRQGVMSQQGEAPPTRGFYDQDSFSSFEEASSPDCKRRFDLGSGGKREGGGESGVVKRKGVSFPGNDDDDDNDNDSPDDNSERSGKAKKKGVSFPQDEEEEEEQHEDEEKKEIVDPNVAEEAIQRIAYELANEMIQKALETFPAGSVVKEITPGGGEGAAEEASSGRGGGGRELDLLPAHPSISEDSSPTMDDESEDSEQQPSAFPEDKDDEDKEEAGKKSQAEARAVGGENTASPEEDMEMFSSSESEQLALASRATGTTMMKMSSSLADELAQAMSGENRQRDNSESPSESGEEETLAKRREGEGERGGDNSERRGDHSEAEGGVPKSSSYEIETEYLCDMDPMQKMGVFHNQQAGEAGGVGGCGGGGVVSIETDADKEVVEGASFRKVSGQEYNTVQEEILDQIRQEAKERELSQMQRSSVMEEEAKTGGDDDHDDDDDEEEDDDDVHKEEEKKRVGLEQEFTLDDSLTDEQGKRTLRAARDGELYASALENERAVIDVEDQTTILQSNSSSDASHAHPLMLGGATEDESYTEEPELEEKVFSKQASSSLLSSSSSSQPMKKKIDVPRGEGEGGEFCYESFGAESPRAGATEEEGRMKKGKERGSGGGGGVARTVSAVSESSLKGVELCDEWQDDEMPRMLGAEGQTDAQQSAEKRRVVPDDGLTGRGEVEGDDLDHVDVVDSDSEVDSNMDNDQLEWENDTPVRTPPPSKKNRATEEQQGGSSIPQYTAEEERRDAQSWKLVRVGDTETFRLDMRVIEPYKRVLSHGGYCGQGLTAMIVFSACYLPSRDRKDYSYVMNHLFHYVLHTLDELVADDYMIVYFHGATPRKQMPSFSWLKKCYQAIDRRLRKNLRALYLIHPTLWLKTVVLMTRPFISNKFSSKLHFVRTLADLRVLIPMEYVYIPEIVQRYDDRHFNPSISTPPTAASSAVQQ